MIEFEDEAPDDEAPDEELAQPHRRELPFSPRVRKVLAAVATLAALGAVVTYVTVSDRHDTTPAARASTPSIPATYSPYTPGLLVEHLGDRNGTLRNDVEVTIPSRLSAQPCPTANDGLAACAVHAGVPAAFAAAVRAQFPQARHATASTAVLRPADSLTQPGLWTRTYRASVPGGTLTVLVRRREQDVDVTPISLQLGSKNIEYVRHVDAHYAVEIQYVTRDKRDRQAALQALAADARLVRP